MKIQKLTIIKNTKIYIGSGNFQYSMKNLTAYLHKSSWWVINVIGFAIQKCFKLFMYILQ